MLMFYCYQWRIQDFPDRGHQPLNLGQKAIIWQDFTENCMRMKEIGPRGGMCPWHSPWIRQQLLLLGKLTEGGNGYLLLEQTLLIITHCLIILVAKNNYYQTGIFSDISSFSFSKRMDSGILQTLSVSVSSVMYYVS